MLLKKKTIKKDEKVWRKKNNHNTTIPSFFQKSEKYAELKVFKVFKFQKVNFSNLRIFKEIIFFSKLEIGSKNSTTNSRVNRKRLPYILQKWKKLVIRFHWYRQVQIIV